MRAVPDAAADSRQQTTATRLYVDGTEADGEAGVLGVADPARGGAQVGAAAAASRAQALGAVAAVAPFGGEYAGILARETGKVLGEAHGDVFVFSHRCGRATAMADRIDDEGRPARLKSRVEAAA